MIDVVIAAKSDPRAPALGPASAVHIASFGFMDTDQDDGGMFEAGALDEQRVVPLDVLVWLARAWCSLDRALRSNPGVGCQSPPQLALNFQLDASSTKCTSLQMLHETSCGKNVSGFPPFRGNTTTGHHGVPGHPTLRGTATAGHRKYNHGWTDVPGHPSLRGHATAG